MNLLSSPDDSSGSSGLADSGRPAPEWRNLRRAAAPRRLEWVAEKAIFLVSLTSILMVLLIFVFVGREALPVLLGQVSTARATSARPVSDLDRMPPEELRAYLELSPQDYAKLNRDGLAALMDLKLREAGSAAAEPDAGRNTVAWRYLLAPHAWNGHTRPEYLWQPVSPVPKFNLVPLVAGSLKVALVALLFGVPPALAAALYVSQLCSSRWRGILQPAMELLAGVPSVVWGVFALFFLADPLQRAFGYPGRLNALVAGVALGCAIVPLVFSLAVDALSRVPGDYTRSALALGASRWQAAWQVALPAALPGVYTAVLLGFGRALGETMIVLMATGNASILSASVFDSTRTLTATIAAEMAEVVRGGPHYRVLFLLGTGLLLLTFLINLAAGAIGRRWQRRLEGLA